MDGPVCGRLASILLILIFKIRGDQREVVSYFDTFDSTIRDGL